MNKIWIYPYKSGSSSARALARQLGGRVIKRRNSRYRYRRGHVIINWGSTHGRGYLMINSSSAVTSASCKTRCLTALQLAGVSVPRFTTDREVAEQWIADGKISVCRTLTRASSGRGIVVAETPDQMVDAPLYTQYVPKRQEFRVHVFDGQVIDLQRKALRRDVDREEANWRIRNHANGFVFARGDMDQYDDSRLTSTAVDAVAALGLVFGAVDIVWNERQDAYYVLEVNTAPGLEVSTLTNYANAINQYIQ